MQIPTYIANGKIVIDLSECRDCSGNRATEAGFWEVDMGSHGTCEPHLGCLMSSYGILLLVLYAQ